MGDEPVNDPRAVLRVEIPLPLNDAQEHYAAFMLMEVANDIATSATFAKHARRRAEFNNGTVRWEWSVND